MRMRKTTYVTCIKLPYGDAVSVENCVYSYDTVLRLFAKKDLVKKRSSR